MKNSLEEQIHELVKSGRLSTLVAEALTEHYFKQGGLSPDKVKATRAPSKVDLMELMDLMVQGHMVHNRVLVRAQVMKDSFITYTALLIIVHSLLCTTIAICVRMFHFIYIVRKTSVTKFQ